MSRLSVSTPAILRTFTTRNAGKACADRIKPTNFGLSVTLAPLAHPIGIDPARVHLLAAYEKDASRWLHRDWYDKYSGRAFRIGTRRAREEAAPHVLCLKRWLGGSHSLAPLSVGSQLMLGSFGLPPRGEK